MNISNDTKIKLIDLESKVLDVVAAQLDAPEREILLEQFEHAIVRDRTMTGHGFYLTFIIDSEVSKLPKQLQNIGNVSAEISGLKHGAGFNLYIKDGIVDHLEGYCYEDQWPDPWPNSEPFEVKDMSRI